MDGCSGRREGETGSRVVLGRCRRRCAGTPLNGGGVRIRRRRLRSASGWDPSAGTVEGGGRRGGVDADGPNVYDE